ncbi:unnamed protein product [Closterium sp. Yama58-4]|nr:unnamed protein product [Closterium sp. Yama58-4]
MAARFGGGLLLVAVMCVAAAYVPRSCRAQPPPPTKAQLRAELQSMAKSIVKRYPQYSRYAQDATKYINFAHMPFRVCSPHDRTNLTIPSGPTQHPSFSFFRHHSLLFLSHLFSPLHPPPFPPPAPSPPPSPPCPCSELHSPPFLLPSPSPPLPVPPLPLAVNSKYDLSALRDASILIPNNVQAEALAKRIPAKSSSVPTLYNITAFHILRRRMTLPQMRQVKLRTAIGTQLRQPLFKMTPMGNNSAVSFARGPYLKVDQWTTIRIPGLYVGRWFIAHGVDRVIIPTHTKI